MFKSKKAKGVNNFLIIRRDSKPDTSSGGIALPETAIVAPDWATVVVAPRLIKDRYGKRKSQLKKGDRIFLRPMDGYKEWDLDKNLQTCVYNHVYAVERDGVVVPFDHKVFIKKPKAADTFFASIIIIPDSVKNRDAEDKGEIISLGEAVDIKDLQVGQVVLFDEDKAALISKSDDIYSIEEENIFGVFSDD